MGEIYDKWSVCDWKVRCWEQEPTVSPFRGKVVLVEASFGAEEHTTRSKMPFNRHRYKIYGIV